MDGYMVSRGFGVSPYNQLPLYFILIFITMLFKIRLKLAP